MIEVSAERRIAAAPDALWPVVSDPARLPEWFTFAGGRIREIRSYYQQREETTGLEFAGLHPA